MVCNRYAENPVFTRFDATALRGYDLFGLKCDSLIAKIWILLAESRFGKTLAEQDRDHE